MTLKIQRRGRREILLRDGVNVSTILRDGSRGLEDSTLNTQGGVNCCSFLGRSFKFVSFYVARLRLDILGDLKLGSRKLGSGLESREMIMNGANSPSGKTYFDNW